MIATFNIVKKQENNMNSEQAEKVLNKMINVCHFEQHLVKQYNQCVVDLLLYGNNTFSLDLYLKLANSPMNNHNFFHKMAMRFCLENINVETNDIEDNVDYIPKQIEGYNYWACDENGEANYFTHKPVIGQVHNSWFFSVKDMHECKSKVDYSFKAEKYPNIVANWENSLIEF